MSGLSSTGSPAKIPVPVTEDDVVRASVRGIWYRGPVSTSGSRSGRECRTLGTRAPRR